MPNYKLHTFQPFIIYSATLSSPALPIPPEEPVTIQHGTSVTGLISPDFTYTNDAKFLRLIQSFKLLLFVPHDTETLHVWFVVADPSWSRLSNSSNTCFLKVWHNILLCPLPAWFCLFPHFAPFCLLMQSRIKFAFWAKSAHCWVTSSLSSTATPSPPHRAALNLFIPQPTLISGVALTQMQHPLDAIPSFTSVNIITQLGVV